ncbi:hypothetical protein [Cohnella boryungensis]|uniref:Butirosin biosynthesis protein H N-terminal domain-containing protein n=1 Tax=Cohnella boryungensis TaxID=768479 RepID=A0ABV8SHN6_9BACL
MIQLPIGKPPIVGLLRWAHTLGITSAYSHTLPWFYSNFIQLSGNRHFIENGEEFFLDFYRGGRKEFDGNNPFLLYRKLGVDVFGMLGLRSMSAFCAEALEAGYYPDVFLDEQWIPQSHAFESYRLPHHLLIYGYDYGKHFYCQGFDKRGIYGDYKVSFDDLDRAYSSVAELVRTGEAGEQGTFLFKLDPDYEYRFDRCAVIGQLKDYLRGDTEENRINRNPGKDVLGIEVYDSLLLYFDCVRREDPRLKGRADIRQLHLLWEHKKTMADRLIYMKREGHLAGADELIASSRSVARMAMTIRNLYLRDAMAQTESSPFAAARVRNLFDLVEHHLLAMKEAETDLIRKLIKSLEQSSGNLTA